MLGKKLKIYLEKTVFMRNLFHLDQILGPTICIHDQMPLKSCASKAGIAQLVERNLAKVEVASSNLVSRSIDLIGKF